MPTRRELKELAVTRLREAEILFEARHYSGAAYLCGYVVELALKARICKLLGTEEYPDSGKLRGAFTVHDLEQLVFLAGLRPKLHKGTALFANWAVAAPWKPEVRYTSPTQISRVEALEILEAIRHPKDGVLQWIKRFW